MAVVKNVAGWEPWYYLKTLMGETIIPYASFPTSYLPARGFKAESFATNCAIGTPWGNYVDPFSVFLEAGGAGSIAETITGIQAAQQAISVPNSMNFSIASTSSNDPPVIGFCIGDKYKEHTYFYLDVTNVGLNELAWNSFIDVFQRSRMRRLYLNYGSVTRYEKDATGKNILTIDMVGSVPKGVASIIVGSTIRFTRKSDGKQISVKVEAVRDNWDLVISDPGTDIPSTGDFYIFDRIFCLQDPLRLCGTWLGTEQDKQSNHPDSGKNLHVTNQNYFYDDVVFTGTYVYFNKITNTIQYASAGSPMIDSGDYEWRWVKSNNYSKSNIFKSNPDRYKETEEIKDGATGATTYGVAKRSTATDIDVTAWVTLPEASYIRLEINVSGSSTSHNWHAPILKNSWLKQGNNYFQILSQVDGCTIDVSLIDSTGKNKLDYKTGGSIFNQYGWFISEHFMDETANGIFGGNNWTGTYDGIINGVASSTIVINTDGENLDTINSLSRTYNPIYLNGVNSFYNRFRLDAPMGGTIKAFNKNDGWMLVCDTGQSFLINTISYSAFPTAANQAYKVTIKINGDISVVELGRELWVTFDNPYKLMTNELNGVYQPSSISLVQSNLCIDFFWSSSFAEIDIPQNTIVGICGGKWWGLSDVVANSSNGLDLFVSTPTVSTGIASAYHNLYQQDLVAYRDYYSRKLTVRRGDLDYREYPQKVEISIGISNAYGTATTFPVQLDQGEERLKSIKMKMPDGNGSACTFQIGSASDYFGFLINGGGEVDLQALRRLGHPPGTVPPSDFKFKGDYVSPVYLYNSAEGISPSRFKKAYMGMSVKDGPIYVKSNSGGSDPTDINLQYVNENQTLENMGFYDLFILPDGEQIIVCGNQVGSFTLDGETYNSGPNSWITNNGVFIIGDAGTNGYDWGCPIVKNLKYNGDSKYQYSLMVLNNVDYLTSSYFEVGSNLYIFAKCYHNQSTTFLGLLSLNVFKIPNNAKLCSAANGRQDFLWKAPELNSRVVNSPTESYTPKEYLIGGSPTTPPSITSDKFIRVMGGASTKSSIESSQTDFGIISSYVLVDGTLVVIYDDPSGIGIIFSNNGGASWAKSKIILARDAFSGLIIGDNVLCYITHNGIEVKNLMDMDIKKTTYAVEGISTTSIERIQEYFDAIKPIPVGSGRIPVQKLSGYKSIIGIYKIYYYDQNNFLTCVQSPNRKNWSIAWNF